MKKVRELIARNRNKKSDRRSKTKQSNGGGIQCPPFIVLVLLLGHPHFLRCSSPLSAYHLPSFSPRNPKAALALGLFAAFKIVREETWEAFNSDTLFFAKIFLLALTLMMDYHLTLCDIYIFTQQPAFKKIGPASKITPLQLESLLTEGSTSKLWPVEFRTSYSPSCIRSSQCFPELSITYSNKSLSFGIVDLGLFPNAAEFFEISLSGSMSQLPAYILFSHGSEVSRYPELDAELKGSRSPITKRFLSQYFKLDLLLLEYINGK